MLNYRRSFSHWIIICFTVFALLAPAILAQDETLADIRYKEDYDRIQSIAKTNPITKRVDRLVAMYGERQDMDIKLRDYADNIFAIDLGSLLGQGNLAAIKSSCEKVLKIRPQFGEAHFYYGVALKNEKKMQEAMMAFARASAIKNPLQTKAKQQLDLSYRSTHNGSLIGEDKLVKEAMKGLK
jgi:tetratricopeptide (TPR) repeat protein